MDGPAKIYTNRKNTIKQFILIERPIKKSSLVKYFELFGSLNNLDTKTDFFPTKFNSVSIVVGTKKMFEKFRDIEVHNGNLWNSIPCYYINRDGKESDTLGIEPLIYFTSSYSLAYQHIIKHEDQKKIKISNIILFNDGFDELQQIITDKFQYGFRILGICTSPIEKRTDTIKYWEWHKEEINLIESL